MLGNNNINTKSRGSESRCLFKKKKKFKQKLYFQRGGGWGPGVVVR